MVELADTPDLKLGKGNLNWEFKSPHGYSGINGMYANGRAVVLKMPRLGVRIPLSRLLRGRDHGWSTTFEQWNVRFA